jgi:transposase
LIIEYYLPPYSPELNRIEILWRKIKYEWIPFTVYLNFTALKSALLDILNNVGSKYQITFG